MYHPLNSSLELVQVGQPDERVSSLLEGLAESVTICSSFRRLKKQMRNDAVGVVLFTINSDEEEELALQSFDFIRNGLQDQDRILLVLHSQERELNALEWIEDFSISGFINLDAEKERFNRKLIVRNIQQWQRNVKRNHQHKAENDLLMCVTRFSRYSENLPSLVTAFSESLANLSFAAAFCRIVINNDGTGYIKNTIPEDDTFSTTLTDAFQLPELPAYLKRALVERKPQIDLLTESSRLKATETYLDTKLGSYLVFPLTVYDKVYELMVFLIPEEYMDSVSMHQIDVITRASEQLTILLERRESELRLKKQYKRLKETLVELKQTQEQLAYSEKMSTVGQLAAGIAHEINNPLAFVLSNFGSIDDYLNSIVNMQVMHERFLNAIDHESKPAIEQLKSEISDFRVNTDMEFIYSDIREIVSDSREGLFRVKEIISDLQLFAHGGQPEKSLVDVSQCIDKTLKLLTPITADKIELNINVSKETSITCHGGYLQQIMTNIIKNAADALLEANLENPKIDIITYEEDGALVLKVKDNGPGISVENQSKIFDPFFTTKKEGSGTGLGMSVTYNLVKKLNGSISVNSEPGRFCEFVVRLPK